MGKAEAAGEQGNGWNRPPREQSDPAGHRGNDDGMSVHGDPTQHGKPQAVRARDPQPDAREGQAGPPGVAVRLVVPRKPGNSGGGKGPPFKAHRRKRPTARRLAQAWNSRVMGWDVSEAMPHRRGPAYVHGDVGNVRSNRPCPRAGCGKSACPVRRAGCGNGARSSTSATAPHLDSTADRRRF